MVRQKCSGIRRSYLEVQLQVKPMWVQDGVQEISLLVKLGNWLQAPV